jgi:hypothetical protein
MPFARLQALLEQSTSEPVRLHAPTNEAGQHAAQYWKALALGAGLALSNDVAHAHGVEHSIAKGQTVSVQQASTANPALLSRAIERGELDDFKALAKNLTAHGKRDTRVIYEFWPVDDEQKSAFVPDELGPMAFARPLEDGSSECVITSLRMDYKAAAVAYGKLNHPEPSMLKALGTLGEEPLGASFVLAHEDTHCRLMKFGLFEAKQLPRSVKNDAIFDFTLLANESVSDAMAAMMLGLRHDRGSVNDFLERFKSVREHGNDAHRTTRAIEFSQKALAQGLIRNEDEAFAAALRFGTQGAVEEMLANAEVRGDPQLQEAVKAHQRVLEKRGREVLAVYRGSNPLENAWDSLKSRLKLAPDLDSPAPRQAGPGLQ